MSYDLSDEQIGILADALRDRTVPGNVASQYLCVNIDDVLAFRYEIERTYGHEVAHKKSFELQEAIHNAIRGSGSVYLYLINNVPGFDNLNRNTRLKYTALARNAWLQRMIETRKIA